MLPDPRIRCPHTGFAKSCRSIVSKYDCPKFVKISGTNPNDGQSMDLFGCVDSFMHMLLIENSQQQRQTGASCDKVANEVAKFHEENSEQQRQTGASCERVATEIASFHYNMAKANAMTLQLMLRPPALPKPDSA